MLIFLSAEVDEKGELRPGAQIMPARTLNEDDKHAIDSPLRLSLGYGFSTRPGRVTPGDPIFVIDAKAHIVDGSLFTNNTADDCGELLSFPSSAHPEESDDETSI